MKQLLEAIQKFAFAETQKETSVAIFQLCNYIEMLETRIEKLEDKLKGYDTLTESKPVH